MSKCFFSKGDHITDENGKPLYTLEEPAGFNDKFYVVHATDIQTGDDCLLKYTVRNGSTYKINNLFREGNFQFQYPFIEKVYGNFQGLDPAGDAIYGVSVEYIRGVELKEYSPELQRKILEKEISEVEAEALIFRQILQFLSGLNYYIEYAEQPYFHRDLKPENIMITEQKDAKIIDFDFAHISGSDKTIHQTGWDLGFSQGYTSPEILSVKSNNREKYLRMELYSAGRVLFYWLNGRDYYTATQMERLEEKDISTTFYFITEGMKYGIRGNADRMKQKYYHPKYAGLIRILDRMCADPKSGECYHSVLDVLNDMKAFLLEYYGGSPEKLEEAIRISEFPLLQERVSQKERKHVFAAWKLPNRPKAGKPLYEYTMRDIIVDGCLLMTIYNLDNRVFYIPALGKDVRREREGADRRILNGDIFLCDSVELTFTIAG